MKTDHLLSLHVLDSFEVQNEELRKTKNELVEIKKKYNELYDFSSSCYFILDQQCNIKKINLSAAALLSIDRNLLTGKSFLNFVALHSQPIFCKYIEETLKTKARVTCEIELLKKGNKRLQVRVESFELEDNLILAKISDITHEKQLELGMIECKKHFLFLEFFFQNSTDALAILDHKFCFMMMNKAFIQSFSTIFAMKIAKGMNFKMIIADFTELKNKLLNACDKAFLGKKTFAYIENISDKDEVYYYYKVYFDPVYNPKNKITFEVFLRIQDLTEEKITQKKLLKQHALLAQATQINAAREMAAALAHEINQPLAAINIYSHGCLQVFSDESIQHSRLLSGLEQISILSVHAGEILHRMKNFLCDGELCLEKTDINNLIKHALTLLEYQKNEFKLDFSLVLNDVLPLIFVDRLKIIQVILNLVQNSVEALHDNMSEPKITILTSLINNQIIEVNFQDNGPGIPQEIADKIMTSYYTTKPRGTGLGLAICRKLIEAHGGKLVLKEADVGAWFCFSLPIKQMVKHVEG